MNSKDLYYAYNARKKQFHAYIDRIKKNSCWDIYTVINATLIKNPYVSIFPKVFFSTQKITYNKIISFLYNIGRYYLKNFYLFISYIIAFVLYKIYYKKQRKNRLKIIIDTFGLVDKTNEEGKFSEKYLTGIYDIFEEHATNYAILLRLYQVGKNPFKLINFFKIINKDTKDYIFEYEFIKLIDLLKLFYLILSYPFFTLRLLQNNKNDVDEIFNYCLLEDIKFFNFDSLTRYIFGLNIAKIESIERIYSWSEFQVIERAFNFGVRTHNNKIELIGLQFFLNYETYFNVVVDDLDYKMLSSPHKVFVNGKYYIEERKKVKYKVGVSLRYKDIFHFQGIQTEEKILLLGSYIESDTKHMINSMKDFDNVVFKNHPAVDIKNFGELPPNMTVSNDNIYELFKNTKIVIGTASGTAVEAVACGLSVIIIASQDNLTSNPLVAYGQGKIWDIAFDIHEIEKVYEQLMIYRNNHKKEIQNIANWYNDNFFEPLTQENLIQVFGFNQ